MNMRTLGAAVLAASSLGLALAGPASAEVCQDCPGGGGGGGGGTNQAPTAVFTLPAEAYRNQVINLDGSGSTDPNGNGTIKAFNWDVTGDTGWDLSGAKTSVSYPTLGDKTIRLQVVDDKNVGNVATKTIKIVNRKPQAQVGCPEFVELGETVTCTPFNPSDADGTITGYKWDLDGDGFDDGSEAAVTFTPTEVGVLRPRLQITDNDGGVTEAITATTVWTPKPGPAFAMGSAVAGQPVTFTAPAGAGEVEGQWAYDRWWSTDGPGTWGKASQDGRVITYTFSVAGTYRVKLRRLRSELPTSSLQETVQTITVAPAPGGGGGENPPAGGGGGGTPAPTQTTPVVTPPAPVGTAATSKAATTKKAAVKKAAAKKKKCRTVKAKKGKKAKKVCAKPKKAARKQKK